MLLAEFFAPLQSFATGAMDAYSNMGRLLGVNAPPKWERSDPRNQIGRWFRLETPESFFDSWRAPAHRIIHCDNAAARLLLTRRWKA